jgi:UDP-glucuronate 4-epimerase
MDVVSLIEQNLGKKAEIEFLPMQLGDVPESFADIDYSYEKLSFQPIVSINEGVPKFIEWYKSYNG